MEERIDRYDDVPQERDFVSKYAPHACCLALLLSATIVGVVIYGIYKLIMWLI